MKSERFLAGYPANDFLRDVVTILVLSLAPAIGLGMARFAYALVLPSMRSDLAWSYTEAGWLNASNAAGYLLGALLCARAVVKFGAFRVMVLGAWACVGALLLCAMTEQTILLNVARGIAGLGGGFAFVSGGVLAARIAQNNPAQGAFLLGLFYAGPGLGIFLSGVTVPFVLEFSSEYGWRMAWAILAGQAFVLALTIAWRAGRYAPPGGAPSLDQQQRKGRPRMRLLLGGYFLFGAGYIAYMTFMIAWVQSDGGAAGIQALFWAVIGAAAMASPWIWSELLRSLRNGHAFAVLTAVTAVGAVLPLVWGSLDALLVSASLFGVAFFAVVASTTAFVRRNLPPADWASAIGTLTVSFSLGQMIGPVLVGAVNDRTQGLSGGLWVSTLLLVVAAVVGGLQRDSSDHIRGT